MKDVKIIIKKVNELPQYIIDDNGEKYWDYPFEELSHIFESIEDELMSQCEDSCEKTMLLYKNRLYEC